MKESHPAAPGVSLGRARTVMDTGHVIDLKTTEEKLGLSLSLGRYILGTSPKVPFSVSTLRECRSTHLLIYLAPVSLSHLWLHFPYLFAETETNSRPRFVLSDFGKQLAPEGWQLIRMSEMPHTLNCSFGVQQCLLGQSEYIPPAATMVQTVMLHWLLTGRSLLDGLKLRTATSTTEGHVVIGSNPSDLRLRLEIAGADYAHERLGLASARIPISL